MTTNAKKPVSHVRRPAGTGGLVPTGVILPRVLNKIENAHRRNRETQDRSEAALTDVEA